VRTSRDSRWASTIKSEEIDLELHADREPPGARTLRWAIRASGWNHTAGRTKGRKSIYAEMILQRNGE
jgi:hypothetical protein